MTFDQEVIERVTVNISLGQQHDVMDGVVFQIQEPVDNKNYGTIGVKEVHDSGSTCEIIAMEHEAFWSAALAAVRENQPKIINAPKNKLIPQISTEIENNLANELLRLLDGRKASNLID